MDKEKYIATAAVIALGTDATRIPSYVSSGFLSEQYYYIIPILLATAVVGSYVGRKIVTRINQDKFKKMVLIAIIFASIKFIVDGIRSNNEQEKVLVGKVTNNLYFYILIRNGYGISLGLEPEPLLYEC